MKSISYLISSILSWRFLPRSPLLTALIIALTARRFYRIRSPQTKQRQRIFFIPKTLFKEDLLNVFRLDDAEYELWYIAREPLRRCASFFLQPHLSEYVYQLVDAATAFQKDALRAHWFKTLKILKQIIRPSAFLSCAYYYKEEREFAAASVANNIPFVALHKECITTPVTRVARQEVYGKNSGPFTGTRITTYNESEKATMVAAGCADAAIIDVVGCPRMDSIFARPPSAILKGAFDVVFFSFSKTTYLPVFRKVPRWPSVVDNVPITPWNWSELYNRYHTFAVGFARSHPMLKVALKVKTGFNISDVLGSGALSDNLPGNLEIISGGEGGMLACSAKVISGFNSTVLLEALAAKTPIVIPAFAEARVGSVAERYGTLRLGATVRYAAKEHSFEHLLAECASRTPNRHRSFTSDERQVLERYIGFVDGQSGRRMRNSIARAIKSLNPRHASIN